MEKSSNNSDLKDHISQIEFALQQGPGWFGFGDRAGYDKYINFMQDHYNQLCKKVNLKGTDSLTQRDIDWVFELKEKIKKEEIETKSVKPEKKSYCCDISGLDKKKVLRALFEAADYQGLGYLSIGQQLTDEEIEKICSREIINIDYLKGKSMKIDLSGTEINTYLYNRDNGADAAEKALEQLRK